MAYHHDLLRQARFLATRELRRPSQAGLRRAVSAAYYAIFHLLIDSATRQMLGASHRMQKYRRSTGRAFDHSAMVEVCKSFSSGTLPRDVRLALGNVVIPQDLRMVTDAFVTLQEERHRADYNLYSPFQKAEAIALIEEVEEAFEAWQRVRNDERAQFFLVAVAFGWKRFRS